jgi:hypothetical protein
MDKDVTEISTPKLIELLSKPNGLRLSDLLFLQGEKIAPSGETVQILLKAVYPETGEFEISMPDKGHSRPDKLNHAILADAGWFPSPQLSELIRHAEKSTSVLDHDDLAEVQARIEREREIAKRNRESDAHSKKCEAALRAALDALHIPDANVRDWHLVLLAMFRHHDQLSIRDGKEAQFFEDQVTAAREHGVALRSSLKQWTWQRDILQRSAQKLREKLAA